MFLPFPSACRAGSAVGLRGPTILPQTSVAELKSSAREPTRSIKVRCAQRVEIEMADENGPSGREADTEERIRARAHQIWNDAGQPDGRHEEHWEQATREIRAESNMQADEGSARPSGHTGVATGLQPGGTIPANTPGATVGSIGTGGGSTAGNPTGSAKKGPRR